MRWRALAAVLILLSVPQPARADFRGHLEVLGALYPTVDLGEGRVRLFASYETEIGDRWFVLASGHVDGLVGTGDRASAGVARPLETFIERRGERVQLRLGLSNVVWGVIDEVAPQDVINPIDVARFVLEGRAEARLPVPLARLRLLLPADLSVEAVVVPFARRGTFDQLDERRSPFAHPRLRGLLGLPSTHSNVEGGVRLHGTRTGFDWGASVYRDVVDFARYTLSPTGIVANRPSRWMAGGDIEAARGDWVLRGEGAMFFGDPLQNERVPLVVSRSTLQGGVGADRRVGETTVFLDAIYRFVPGDPLLGDEANDNELSVVAGLTRDLSGGAGTRTLRLFGLWNTSDRSAFARAIWSTDFGERLNLEVGGAAFLGSGGAFFGFLTDSDVIHARLRIRF